jgi:hypothetical protein
VRCLLNMAEPQEALKLIEAAPEAPDLEFQETLLECLKAARPDSGRIPSLVHRVLDLRIAAALGREQISRAGHASSAPLVHGEPVE